MKNLLTLFFLGLSLNVMATDIKCSLYENLEEKFIVSKNVEIGEKVKFESLKEFTLYVNKRDKNNFEIEVFDGGTPARNYASGSLVDYYDEIEWNLWRRDILLQIKCSLAN